MRYIKRDNYKKAIIEAGFYGREHQLAKANLGVTPEWWSRVVNGRIPCPEKHVEALCWKLEKSKRYLFQKEKP